MLQLLLLSRSKHTSTFAGSSVPSKSSVQLRSHILLLPLILRQLGKHTHSISCTSQKHGAHDLEFLGRDQSEIWEEIIQHSKMPKIWTSDFCWVESARNERFKQKLLTFKGKPSTNWVVMYNVSIMYGQKCWKFNFRKNWHPLSKCVTMTKNQWSFPILKYDEISSYLDHNPWEWKALSVYTSSPYECPQ